MDAEAGILRHVPEVSGVLYAEFACTPGRLALPDFACDLIWTGEELRVIGPMSRGLIVERAYRSMAILTLGAAGAASLLPMPRAELTDQNLAIADVAPRHAAALEDLFARGGAGRLVRPSHLREARTPRLSAAARALSRGDAPARVAAQLEVSERHLRREFRAAVGLAPGQFQQILRFRRTIARVRAGQSLVAASHAAGYADQPHFNRECRALTGLSPRRAVASLGPMEEVLNGWRSEDDEGF